VRYISYLRGERLLAGRVDYDLAAHTGKFFEVKGMSPGKIDPRPGLLQTDNPFLFQGEWAERLKDRYILHNGFITDCRLPNPWWRLRAPIFDIIPGERAIARRAVFRVRNVPIFYTPYFYKALGEEPRKSGFLTPNIGNSSRRGLMLGAGYYWALHRSYDVAYRTQLFSERGFAHQFDFRGKPTQKSDFNAYFYGVKDKGLRLDNGDRIKQGGFLFNVDGKAELPWGFSSRAGVNYLSSFTFRQAFTESFNEAVFSEVRSSGFAARHWDAYSLNIAFDRLENYQSDRTGDRIVIRKLPSIEFQSSDKKVTDKVIPIWVSLESSAAFVRRNQPLFQTRQFVERIDLRPRVMTAFRFKDIHLLPYASLRETKYGSSVQEGMISGHGVLRSTQEAGVDLILPSLARVFTSPKWLGDRVKHVIEPRAGFRYVNGVGDFREIIRFDETDLVTNTKEIDYSLTNRLFVKRGGSVNEVLSWQLWQKRYLDPDLGGAIQTGVRNVFLTQTEMTAYAFFSGPRNYSPVVSVLRLSPHPSMGAEWRSDYDPLRKRISNSSLQASLRVQKIFLSAGHNHVRSIPNLSPSANQFIGILGYGNSSRRGWSLGFQSVYDFRLGVMQFATTQLSFNSDCCGLSIQYRRFNFGARNENQFRVAFAVANIGSFGTLRRQESIF
jgi:LPS-assembly protein